MIVSHVSDQSGMSRDNLRADVLGRPVRPDDVLREITRLAEGYTQPEVLRALLSVVRAGRPAGMSDDAARQAERTYMGFYSQLPDLLLLTTPYLWTPSMWEMAEYLTDSYPRDASWNVDMLHSPSMFWALERIVEVDFEKNTGHDRPHSFGPLGFCGVAAMGIMPGILDATTSVYEQQWRAREDVNAISVVLFVVSTEIKLPYKLPIPVPIIARVGQQGMGDVSRLAACAADLLCSHVVETSDQSASSGTQHKYGRVASRSAPPIRVIRLRRVNTRGEPSEDRDVNWSCRWLVRPHFRNQWHPSTQTHKRRLIGSYVKGPEDQPLRLPKPAIYSVDR